MSMNFRYPNISGKSEKEELTQIKSYLHQLVDQLNYLTSIIDVGNESEQEDPADLSAPSVDI